MSNDKLTTKQGQELTYPEAVAQVVSGLRGGIAVLLKQSKIGSFQQTMISSALNSDMGAKVLSTLIGEALSLMPEVSEDERVKKLIVEFRAQGSK